MSVKSNCCRTHGDIASLRSVILQGSEKFELRAGANAPAIPISAGCIAVTGFWINSFGYAFVKQKLGTLHFTANNVCKNHQRKTCNKGEGCHWVHICRELWPVILRSLHTAQAKAIHISPSTLEGGVLADPNKKQQAVVQPGLLPPKQTEVHADQFAGGQYLLIPLPPTQPKAASQAFGEDGNGLMSFQFPLGNDVEKTWSPMLQVTNCQPQQADQYLKFPHASAMNPDPQFLSTQQQLQQFTAAFSDTLQGVQMMSPFTFNPMVTVGLSPPNIAPHPTPSSAIISIGSPEPLKASREHPNAFSASASKVVSSPQPTQYPPRVPSPKPSQSALASLFAMPICVGIPALGPVAMDAAHQSPAPTPAVHAELSKGLLTPNMLTRKQRRGSSTKRTSPSEEVTLGPRQAQRKYSDPGSSPGPSEGESSDEDQSLLTSKSGGLSQDNVWAEKMKATRGKFRNLRSGALLGVQMAQGPGDVPSFSAGRGRPIAC